MPLNAHETEGLGANKTEITREQVEKTLKFKSKDGAAETIRINIFRSSEVEVLLQRTG